MFHPDNLSLAVKIQGLMLVCGQVRCLDNERLFQEQTMVRFKETLHAEKIENQSLMERVSQLEGVEVQLAE